MKKTEIARFDDELLVVKGDVIASYDMGNITGNIKKEYTTVIIIQKHTGTILGGKCECKAGLGGYCKHVAAIIVQILDYQRMGKEFLPRHISKTSKPQSWGRPRITSSTCVLFRDLDFAAYDYERDMHAKIRKTHKDYTSFQACPVGNDCLKQDKIETFQQSLRAQGRAHQLVKILSDNDCQPVHTPIIALSSQINEQNKIPPQLSQQVDIDNGDSHLKFNISEPDYQYYLKHIQVNSSQAKAISDKTKGQSSNPMWYVERSKRITASNFKLICNMKESTDPKKRLSLMCNATKPTRKRKMNDPRTWGTLAEPIALSQYKSRMEQQGFRVTMTDLGLVINPQFPFLGASLDSFVTLCDGSEVSHGVVEVKSLVKLAHLTPEEAGMTGKTFYRYISETGLVEIDKKHTYYLQIQGQLFVSGLRWCDLVIWTPVDVRIHRINRETLEWWTPKLAKLANFYFRHMLPYLHK